MYILPCRLPIRQLLSLPVCLLAMCLRKKKPAHYYRLIMDLQSWHSDFECPPPALSLLPLPPLSLTHSLSLFLSTFFGGDTNNISPPSVSSNAYSVLSQQQKLHRSNDCRPELLSPTWARLVNYSDANRRWYLGPMASLCSIFPLVFMFSSIISALSFSPLCLSTYIYICSSCIATNCLHCAPLCSQSSAVMASVRFFFCPWSCCG